MSDGRVEIKVNVEDSEVGRLNQSLGGIGGAVSKAKIGIKDMAGALGLFKLGSMAIDGITSAFGELTGEMNESMKAWSTFEGNMAMIGKSSDEIAKVQASLQEFATQTIYSASDMASTYSQMAAIGYDKTEQLVKGMGGLAAASENPQQAMRTLSQQMVQALSKPVMRWEDFKLMLEQAPASMSEVAKHMGMSLDELVVAIQDGEITSKRFADAIAEVGTNENFSKMATTYKTADQAMDGLKETLANKLLPVYEKWQEFQIKGIESITDLVDSFDINGLINGFNKALPNIQKVTNNIGKFLTTGAQKATKFFKPMTDGFVKIGKDMLGFYGSFGDMFDKIADGDWEGGLKAYSDAFSKTFDNIVDNSKNIVTGMKDNLFKAIGAISWSDVGTKVGSVLSDGIDWGASLLSTGWDIASSIVDKVTSVDWGNALYSFTTNVAGFAKNAYSEVKANLDERFGDGKLGQSIIDQIFNPDSELRVTLDKIDTAITEGLKGAIDGVSEVLLGMSISDIDASLETLFGKIGDIEFTGDFGQLVADIKTAISESFGDLPFNDLLPEVSWGDWHLDWDSPIQSLQDGMAAGWERIKSAWDSFWSGQYLPEFEWPDWDFPAWTWPTWTWPDWDMPDLGIDVDITEGVNELSSSISQWFNEFSWPEISWPEWSWPEISLPEININFGEVLGKIKEAFDGFMADFNSWKSGLDFSFLNPTNWFGGGGETPEVNVPVPDVTEIQTLNGTFNLGELILTADSVSMAEITSVMEEEVNTTMEAVRNHFDDGMKNSYQAVMNGMGQVNQAFTSGYQTGLVNARGFSDSLVMIFENIAVRLQQSGMNAGEGFALGLESTRGRIMSTARSIANEVVTTINRALDEHSPSRVLFKSGAFAGEGFALGLDSWVDRVSGISTNLAMASVPDLSKVNHKFSGVNGTISQIIQSANDSNNAVVVEAIESLEETLTQKQFAITSDEVADKTQNRLDKTIGKNAKYNEAWGVGG